ncbi:PREDICTED: uncharacterized protein LOC18599489 isoform X2 [Theobroma cacao]|uniref:Uncharacterized protein LOC18599489 isoform X2 n=1 Tax=Theobroma cacao TaxID=3641 RepID=A0AB32WG68_THECC|nr:PREDICTED: uncharacterized protein LOC18599489 isoform X2 [Theobroma cacao]
MDRQQPFFLFEKVIHQLDELSLNRDDIASITDRRYPMDYFHYVKVLRVVSCPDNISGFLSFLERFYNLKKLVVVSCKFRELFEGTSLSRVIKKLESTEVWECDLLSNLTPSASFQSLTTLDVWNCQGMINLVSSSTARTLVQLMDIRIRECNKLTEIVAEEEGDRGDKIVFQNLKFLEFQSLERLTSFCQGNLGFDFPALEKVIVEQCPNMNSFCQGKLITGILRVKPGEGKGKGRQTDDLNADIKRLSEEEKPSREGRTQQS